MVVCLYLSRNLLPRNCNSDSYFAVIAMLIHGKHNMDDPIGAFGKIRDSVLLYLKTAFATQYPSVEVERERLLRAPRTFYQEPWIEPLARYVTERPISRLASG